MKKRQALVTLLGAASTLLLAFVVYGQAGQRGQAPAPPAAVNRAQNYTAQRTLLNDYCVECHNNRVRTANLSLEALDISRVAANREKWEKVVRKLRAGMMPPPDQERPGK